MKVLLLNGSPRVDGNTSIVLGGMEAVFTEEGIEHETIQVGNLDIRGCTACGECRKIGKCIYDDIVNEIASKFEQSDGLVLASPVYYASANGTLISLLDRLFYSTSFDKRMKVGASVAVARRGGCSATYDELNKYFAIGTEYCYYFNPNSDGYRGKLLTDTVIDDYTVDSQGRWAVDGVPQTSKSAAAGQ